MGKPKLHELIAVEGELEGAVKKILEEATVTFDKKPQLFLGMTRSLKMLADTAEARADEAAGAEGIALTTTVGEKLDYIRSPVIRYWDAVLQKEATNQAATADLVIDGTLMASAVPATFLLGMETKLKALRAVYEAIPTLSPGRKWMLDATQAHPGVFIDTDTEMKIRTKKLAKPVVLYEATKEHPAQVKEMVEDVTVGTISIQTWSGMVSPADKSAMLGRIDSLIRACKKARQRANATEVVRRQIGNAMLAYVNTGKLGGEVVADATPDTE